MNNLPTLYSRNQDGSVQQWTIFYDEDGYWTESGRVDGVITQHGKVACVGKNLGKKNETTAAQQAASEARSKFDKKLKTGHFEDVAHIDNFYFVEPQLAVALDKVKAGLVTPCLVQCKYNGGCVIATRKGLFSRKGEEYLSIPHIQQALKPIFDKYPNAVLHGEAFNEGLRQHLNEIMKILRRTVNVTSEVLQRSEQLVRFYIYDGYGFEGMEEETPYKDRKAAIDNIIAGHPKYLFQVPTAKCLTQKEVWALYQSYIDDGHEGAIVRYEDNIYEHKRTQKLIKLKPTDDDEFLVVALHEGTGDWAGTARRVDFKMKNGEVFGGNFKGKFEQAKDAWEHPEKYVGKVVTVSYNGLTGLNTPNFAQLDPDNCFKS
jgi:hypothetical protein